MTGALGAPPLLRLAGVAKSYRSGQASTPVLSDVDLVLRRGEITCLLGPSGSGKSTLVALIAGLLRPDAGRVEFDGIDLETLNDRRRSQLRARRIGVVLQDGNLVPFLTAAENTRLVARLAGTGMPRATATALLEQVGLAERATHLPRRLSGGEAQRAALAVALANEPDLLLADEVVGQLDSTTAQSVLDVLRRACAERGLAVLLVTHDEQVARTGDRALRLIDGRLESAGLTPTPTPATPTARGAGVDVRGLRQEYASAHGRLVALDGIDLTVPAGENVAIVGPSGSGKSTLLGLLGGLELPTEGQVRIGEHPMSSMSDQARARIRRQHIGFVFQADNLQPFLTVSENIGLQSVLAGVPDDPTWRQELLDALDIGELAHRYPDQLSGGQRQRVALARALVHSPHLVLADEPTGALDATSADRAMDLLLRLHRRAGATLVIVTHDRSVAQRCDRMLEMRAGRLTEIAQREI